ncbi:uncharacterized protein F5891DRAFT_1256151 [Suillus fuscotomentosus]|uniref:Uncharacterized protein n=1 Tax=Suillus fuscotomentosus TaxID=1912939 RepID=A0AAD4DUR9_9AGAM|nr:uncharacterized protein F5891DRAFT_1256151 [Suillus fuscotomentosus]KAG1894306.1 hypothetical protein F5891DRAFT_1256151 [Suillus fuscotomentosus]
MNLFAIPSPSSLWTTLHPIPHNNLTIFEEVINKTTYASIPNLLNWETAHEPNGNSDPLDAAQSTCDLIYKLDGYHPVSTVLNCQDYNFSPYINGADIVLYYANLIGINTTFSPMWHTVCTLDFGHCGCDNCKGTLYDVRARVQTFKDRLNILGFDRTKSVWTMPQAFGSGAYRNTAPTGQHWAALGFTSFNHGALGRLCDVPDMNKTDLRRQRGRNQLVHEQEAVLVGKIGKVAHRP